MAGKRGFHFDTRLLEHINDGRLNEVKSMLNEDLIRASDQSKNTLLHYAILGNSEEIVRHLIELGAEIDSPGKDGNTPLLLAVKNDNRLIDDFMVARSNAPIVNYDVFIALRMARTRSVKILKLLVSRLESQTVVIEELVDKLVSADCSLVHCVIYLKDIEVIRCMLQGGFDVNSKDHGGMTALHTVASMNDVSLVKLLIDYGADVNQLNEIGMTPLSIAIYYGNRETMKVLLEAGTDPNLTDSHLNFAPVTMVFENLKNISTEKMDECLELLFQYAAIPQNPSQLIDIASSKNDSKKINMLINYLVILKTLGRPIADTDLHCKQKQLRSTITVLVNSCENFLRSSVFENLTVLELLIGSEDKMRTLARNANLILELQQLLSDDENKKLFPYYCSALTKRISKARRVMTLEDAAIPILCKLLNHSYNQCYNFARDIVGYLSERDLEQLCRV